MHPFITKPLDRLIIRLACMAQPPPGKFQPRVEEARSLLQQPDFFDAKIPVPSNVKWSSEHDFEFRSSIESPWAETQTVYGKLFRCGEDWASQPTMILIHGWNDDIGYKTRHVYLTRKFSQIGINTAMIELPYHMQRRPRRNDSVHDFISEDLYCSMLAARQSVADIRSLIAWLEAQGCREIGLWGVSLGGWLAGLTVCHDERARLALLQIPAARMDEVIANAEFCAPIRQSLHGASFDLSKLNLRSHRPKIARENLLLIEAEDDLFVSKKAIEDVWELWGRPEIWRLPHAHISILMSVKTMKQGVEWIASRMGKR